MQDLRRFFVGAIRHFPSPNFCHQLRLRCVTAGLQSEAGVLSIDRGTQNGSYQLSWETEQETLVTVHELLLVEGSYRLPSKTRVEFTLGDPKTTHNGRLVYEITREATVGTKVVRLLTIYARGKVGRCGRWC